MRQSKTDTQYKKPTKQAKMMPIFHDPRLNIRISSNRNDHKRYSQNSINTVNGHDKLLCVPFSLRNNIFRRIQNNKWLVYFNENIARNKKLDEVFDRFRKANFKIQLDKSEFLKKTSRVFRSYCNPWNRKSKSRWLKQFKITLA